MLSCSRVFIILLLENKELLVRFLHNIYSDHLVRFLPCACYNIFKNFIYEIIECLQYFKLLLFLELLTVVTMSSLTIRNHSFSTYAKFSEKLTFLTPWYPMLRTCACQGVRNVSFSENFAYVLNEWFLRCVQKLATYSDYRANMSIFVRGGNVSEEYRIVLLLSMLSYEIQVLWKKNPTPKGNESMIRI